MITWVDPEEAIQHLESGDGAGVRIAVLDSGIEIGHSEFEGRQLIDDLAVNEDHTLGAGEGNDPLGHGTAVASLIWKMAPKAEIGSFRVLKANLRGRSTRIAAAAEEAIRQGYHLVNCSFGCRISGHIFLYKDWIDSAYRSNVHVIAASSGHVHYEWPAQLPSVLSIGCDQEKRESPFLHLNGGLVEFAASAGDYHVAWRENGHRTMIGSSFSAACFSGIVARLLAFYPKLHPLQLKVLLANLASRIRV